MRVANGRNRTGSHTRKQDTGSIAKSAVFGLSIETGFIALRNAGNPSLLSLLFLTAHIAAWNRFEIHIKSATQTGCFAVEVVKMHFNAFDGTIFKLKVKEITGLFLLLKRKKQN